MYQRNNIARTVQANPAFMYVGRKIMKLVIPQRGVMCDLIIVATSKVNPVLLPLSPHISQSDSKCGGNWEDSEGDAGWNGMERGRTERKRDKIGKAHTYENATMQRNIVKCGVGVALTLPACHY